MHVRALLATTAVLALTLTGCGNDDPKPKMQPTKTAEPSATETVEPETPREFFDRWLATETAMLNSGDTSEYSKLTKGCQPCEDLSARVTDIYAAGGSIETRGATVSRSKHINGDEYLVWITSAPTTLVESSGASPKQLNGGKVLFRVVADRSGETFNITHYVQRAQ